MSWLNKAKDAVSKGLDQAQEGIDNGVKNAMEGLEKGIEKSQENLSDAAKERRANKELIRERRRLFNVTLKSEYIEADLDNHLWRLTSARKDIYDLTDLVSYELLQDGDALTSGGLGIGRALVGGALVGGTGALLGGLTKKKQTSKVTHNLQIRLANSATKEPTTFITFIDKKTKNKSKKYKLAIKSARETLDVLDIMTNEAEKINHIEPVEENSTNNLDEIRQLKELLDDGIITQEEFDRKKEMLLF